jgi:hypothetical protein
MKTVLKIRKMTRRGLKTIATLVFIGENRRKMAESASWAALRAAKIESSEIGGISCEISTES